MYALTLAMFTIAALAGLSAFGIGSERIGMVDDAVFLIATFAAVAALVRLLVQHAAGEVHRSPEPLEDASAAPKQ